MSSPSFPVRGCTGPLPVHAFPTHWFFLRPEACLTELTAAVAVSSAAKTFSSEDLRLAILAVGAVHGHNPLFFGTQVGSQSQAFFEPGKGSPMEFEDEAEKTIVSSSPSLVLG